MSESKELINWEERLAAEAKAVATIERPSLTSISLRSGMMSINDVPVPGNKLLCVVVASVFENQYFSQPYDANNIVSPDCFALAPSKDELIPHSVVPSPFNATCAGCPMSEWGSDPKPNSKGKACKEKRRLAVLPASALTDGNVMKAEMATLTLPVTSVRNWGNFVNQAAAEFGRPPWALLTEISVHPHIKNQFEVKFAVAGTVQDAYLGELSKRIESATEVLMTPYDMANVAKPPVQKAAPEKTGKKY